MAFAVAIAASGLAPWTVPGIYVTLSAATFVAYGLDKRAAEKGLWRTEEAVLHLLAVVGGWPGALAARSVFRHKTVKQPFRTIFWATVFVNVALLMTFLGYLRTLAALG